MTFVTLMQTIIYLFPSSLQRPNSLSFVTGIYKDLVSSLKDLTGYCKEFAIHNGYHSVVTKRCLKMIKEIPR